MISGSSTNTKRRIEHYCTLIPALFILMVQMIPIPVFSAETASGRDSDLLYLPEMTHIRETRHAPVLDPLAPLNMTQPVPSQDPLPGILEKTSAYCEKLAKKVFHFFCYEQVRETLRRDVYSPKVEIMVTDTTPPPTSGSSRPPRATSRTGRTTRMVRDTKTGKRGYINRYQIIQTGGSIREQRELTHFGGKRVRNRAAVRTGQSVIYSFEHALIPVYLFSKTHRDTFDYKLLGKTMELGRNAYIISVHSKFGGEEPGQLLAFAWVDDGDFSILKSQVYPAAFNGYYHLIRSGTGNIKDIKVKDVHYFGVQKDGLRFPSRTEIEVQFKPGTWKRTENKKKGGASYVKFPTILKTTFDYTDYVFFNVPVDDPVFKVLSGNIFVSPRPGAIEKLRVVVPRVEVGHPASDQKALPKVLERAAAYCKKLEDKVFHFFCYETVSEFLDRFEKGGHINTGGKRGYVNEYQIIKTPEGIKEQRELVSLDGKKIKKRRKRKKKQPRQSIIYSYENAIFPVYLFSKRSRGKFRYKLLGKSSVPSMGRNAYVIEVRSAVSHSRVLTVAWVDDRDFSILKFQVYPSAFQGYNHIINSGTGDLTDVSIDD
ncbi:MAG: hypothetical protein GY940_27160, partial [bacterium]|nr:hypothetical protein [bacterium]